jgi:hypothetical protein
MRKDMIDALTASGANVMITMSAEELRDFAEDVARSVAERMSMQTVDAIKDAMGSSAKYCTTEEAVRDFCIPLSTLNNWIAKGYIHPMKKGRKNIYSREELAKVCAKKI